MPYPPQNLSDKIKSPDKKAKRENNIELEDMLAAEVQRKVDKEEDS